MQESEFNKYFYQSEPEVKTKSKQHSIKFKALNA